MNSFRLTVSSPDGNKFQGDCTKLDVRGVEGELAIMAGHIPFVTAVVASTVTIWLDDENKKTGQTLGGLLTVGNDEVTLMSGSFRFDDE